MEIWHWAVGLAFMALGLKGLAEILRFKAVWIIIGLFVLAYVFGPAAAVLVLL